jgi:predicted deacylase
MFEPIKLSDLPSQSRHSVDLDVVRLGDGTFLRLPINIVIGKDKGPSLALVAGVHGDEPDGVLTLMELSNDLDPAGFTGRVVLVTVANPPAFAARRRTSPLDGLDLNRIFPGNPEGSPSERLAYRLFNSVLGECDFLFSLHSWHSAGVVVPYVEFKHNIGTARASLEAAKASGFDLIRVSEWAPGLMTRVVNEAGIPGMEAEIGGAGISTPENRSLYKARIISLMGHLGMVTSPKPLDPARLVDHLDLMAPDGGVLVVTTQLGAEITAGETLAQILDLHSRQIAKVRSPCDGLVGAMCIAGSVQAGELIFRIFRDVLISI